MRPQFRPIPLTILDFMAILLPGTLSYVLLAVFYRSLSLWKPPSVETTWFSIVENATTNNHEWIVLPALTIVVLLIGYTVKPLAMKAADRLVRPIYRFSKSKETRARWSGIGYPFAENHIGKAYYVNVVATLRRRLNLCEEELEALAGHAHVSAAKRYLRLEAPSLWEECERTEAEVRMSGALLVLSIISALEATVSVVWQLSLNHRVSQPTLAWLLMSIIGYWIFAAGFRHLREREVGYTYLNFLLASSHPGNTRDGSADGSE